MRLSLIALILLLTTSAKAIKCPKETRLYFANGMTNSYNDAVLSLLELKKRISSSPNLRKEKSKVAYNPDGFWFGNELAEAALQKRIEVYQDFWNWIFELEKSPQWFQQMAKRIIQKSQLNNLSSVSADHMALYGKDLLEGRSIVVVAHSQGNFFANSSANMLHIQVFPVRSHFKMVSVATPSSKVTNDGPNFTLLSDGVIKWIPQALPANSSNVSPRPGIFDHAFLDHYLAGVPTGSNLLKAIQKAFRDLDQTTLAPKNDKDENCDD